MDEQDILDFSYPVHPEYPCYFQTAHQMVRRVKRIHRRMVQAVRDSNFIHHISHIIHKKTRIPFVLLVLFVANFLFSSTT